MEKICVLKNCLSNYNSDSTELVFHSFPLEDNVKYKRWLRLIPGNLIDLPLQEHTCICGKHFSSDAYQSTALQDLLREDAAPSIFCTAFNADAIKEELVENYRSNAEQTSLSKEVHKTMKKFVDIGIQVSPKKTWATEREAKLRKKKLILQKRLQRREEAIKLMRNIIELLDPRKLNIKAAQIVKIMDDATPAMQQ